MKLSKLNQNGILLVLYLMRSGRTSLRNVAENLGISLHFLEQIGRKLRIHGILKTVRGPGGGYELVSKQVLVADVLKALGTTNNILTTSRRTALRAGEQEHRTLADVSDQISVALQSVLGGILLNQELSITIQREVRQMNTVSEAVVN